MVLAKGKDTARGKLPDGLQQRFPKRITFAFGERGWNSIIEEALPETVPIGGKGAPKSSQKRGAAIDFFALDGGSTAAPRRKTGMNEFDRVAGGGLVEGSAILIGGDPGIGKSTLLLQVTAALAKKARCIYVSGEEAIDQIRLRASRLEVSAEPVNWQQPPMYGIF